MGKSLKVLKLILLTAVYSIFCAILVIVYILIAVPKNDAFEWLGIALPLDPPTQYSDAGLMEDGLSWEFTGNDTTGDYSLSLKIKRMSDSEKDSNIKEALDCLKESSVAIVRELNNKYCPNLPPIVPTWASTLYAVISVIFWIISTFLLFIKIDKDLRKIAQENP